jgi:hypothetical protein
MMWLSLGFWSTFLYLLPLLEFVCLSQLVPLVRSHQTKQWIYLPVGEQERRNSLHFMKENLFKHEKKSGNMLSISVDPSLRCTSYKAQRVLDGKHAGAPDSNPVGVPALHMMGEVAIANTRKIPFNSEPKQGRLFMLFSITMVKKGKTIPVTGRGGSQGCKTSRLPHFLDNRLTDGSEVVSLTRRPPFTPQEVSWYSFMLEAESTPGPYCGWEDKVNLKIQWSCGDSNPRLSGL